MCTKNDLNIITKSVNDSAIKLFKNRLIKIILFGSYARGDYDTESDIDIMLLLDLPTDRINLYFDEIIKLSSKLSLLSENCTTVSIIMQDKATFDKYENVLPFFKNVLKEGFVIKGDE